MLSAEELAVLDAWRFEKTMPSRSDAVRELIRRVSPRSEMAQREEPVSRLGGSRSARRLKPSGVRFQQRFVGLEDLAPQAGRLNSVLGWPTISRNG